MEAGVMQDELISFRILHLARSDPAKKCKEEKIIHKNSPENFVYIFLLFLLLPKQRNSILQGTIQGSYFLRVLLPAYGIAVMPV